MLIDPVNSLDSTVSIVVAGERLSGSFLPPTENPSSGSEDSRCSQVRSMLNDYHDHLLSENDSLDVTDHLFDCKRCSDVYDSIIKAEEFLLREWHKSVPLPSASHTESAIDRIMQAIPESKSPSKFPTKRVHSPTRWMRFPNTWNPLESGL